MAQDLKDFLKTKKQAREKLTKELKISAHRPLVAIILDSDLSTKDQNELSQLLTGIKNLDLEIAILSDQKLALPKHSNICLLTYNEKNRHRLIASADMAVTFHFNDFEELLVHGTIPIARSTKALTDYNPNAETGNSFLYKNANSWSVFAAVVRAAETFRFPYDWQHLMRQGLKTVRNASV